MVAGVGRRRPAAPCAPRLVGRAAYGRGARDIQDRDPGAGRRADRLPGIRGRGRPVRADTRRPRRLLRGSAGCRDSSAACPGDRRRRRRVLAGRALHRVASATAERRESARGRRLLAAGARRAAAGSDGRLGRDRRLGSPGRRSRLARPGRASLAVRSGSRWDPAANGRRHGLFVRDWLRPGRRLGSARGFLGIGPRYVPGTPRALPLVRYVDGNPQDGIRRGRTRHRHGEAGTGVAGARRRSGLCAALSRGIGRGRRAMGTAPGRRRYGR